MINNKRFEIGISLASHVYCIAKVGQSRENILMSKSCSCVAHALKQ